MTRPHKRPDGIPTRCDILYHTPAEVAITMAMEAVEKLGPSGKLTMAVSLLGYARNLVADHVEST